MLFSLDQQFTMKLGDKGKQDVTSDPNENVVTYHVFNPSHEAYIVNDFNKVWKICFILNEKEHLSFILLKIFAS